jgi:hypothetical protein
MHEAERLPRLPSGDLGQARFPTGSCVDVVSGQHVGDCGVVADQKPDLRPGSVWVLLDTAGMRLIPGVRLATRRRDPFMPDDDGWPDPR